MYQVIKRDGKIVDFDINKIAAAIKRHSMPLAPNITTALLIFWR